MNAASLEKSPRLRKVVEFLRTRGNSGATTWEIVQNCNVLAVSAVVSELRQNGVSIVCEAAGRTENGSTIYRYHLGPARPAQGELFAV